VGTTTRTRRFTRRISAPVILLALTGVGLALAAAGPAQASGTTPKPSTSSSTNSSPSKSPSGSTGESPDVSTADFAAATSHGQTRVIIRAADGQLDTVLARVQQLDGKITRPLPVINGFAATLPAAAVAALQADPQVLALTPDAAGQMQSINPMLGYDQADTGALDQISALVGARSMWKAGYTGKGVDVALIDTGVSKVTGLASGNVLNGPDLSTDQASTDLRYRDSYGHGTHMASIIAGRDALSTPAGYAATPSSTYEGIAPDARIISLKVGATDGSADVSQVIAAIGWVTQHARDPGLNIRVLNLSYGTTSTQDYTLDPLSYAVEAAWRKGIVVVVAGGNDGTSKVELANPAQDPNVIAVGAEDPNGTLSTDDDTIPAFSNRGTNKRHVDLVAPGTHVLGLRVPGSAIDLANPGARVGTRFIRGSGTSQATAAASGAIALLLQARPSLTPDQVKWAITTAATPLPRGTATNRGAGLINVRTVLTQLGAVPLPSQALLMAKSTWGTGTGSLELARGASHLVTGVTTINTTTTVATTTEVQLIGEKDIFGAAWTGRTWAPTALAGTAWTGGIWRGNAWTGGAFNANGDWASTVWTAPSWAGASWSGRSWVGRTWVSNAWVGSSWVNSSWSGRTWVSASWSSSIWN
jgi:serine protease AprX